MNQALHDTVGLSGAQETYLSDAGFTGVDHFTFAAWNGSTDSNLGTITLGVGGALPTPTPTTNGLISPSAMPTVTHNPLSAATPRITCRTAGSSLLLLNHDGSACDTVVWKWKRGQATALPDCGNPLASTSFALCLDGGDFALAALTVSPAAERWQPLGAHGSAYRDRNGSAPGRAQGR